MSPEGSRVDMLSHATLDSLLLDCHDHARSLYHTSPPKDQGKGSRRSPSFREYGYCLRKMTTRIHPRLVQGLRDSHALDESVVRLRGWQSWVTAICNQVCCGSCEARLTRSIYVLTCPQCGRQSSPPPPSHLPSNSLVIGVSVSPSGWHLPDRAPV